MPNPNAIVSATVRLEPPLDQRPEEMLRSERGISVEAKRRRMACPGWGQQLILMLRGRQEGRPTSRLLPA